MHLLLDTHIVLWWLADDGRLSRKARELIADPGNMPVVSAATAWEVAIKQALGKLRIDGDFEVAVQEQGFILLPITVRHATETGSLPPIHRDPFDRTLVAQARVENLPLLTADPRVLRYPANIIQA